VSESIATTGHGANPVEPTHSAQPHPELEPVDAIVAALTRHFGAAPETAIVLGSGLGALAARVRDARSVPYEDLALPRPSAIGHSGVATVGTLGGGTAIVMSGRVHLYEGHPARVVVRAVRALSRWGVKRVILTCAAGGISPEYPLGGLVAITDHISFQRENPLTGPVFPGGTRFPDVGDAYAHALRSTLKSAAESLGITLFDGVYGAMNGPAYETPAEIRMLHTVGATLAGMSTVAEILALAELGVPACAVAVVTNPAAGTVEGPVAHDMVTYVANKAVPQLCDLLEATCGKLR
jgi:purine-nucleoside phosphorylase